MCIFLQFLCLPFTTILWRTPYDWMVCYLLYIKTVAWLYTVGYYSKFLAPLSISCSGSRNTSEPTWTPVPAVLPHTSPSPSPVRSRKPKSWIYKGSNTSVQIMQRTHHAFHLRLSSGLSIHSAKLNEWSADDLNAWHWEQNDSLQRTIRFPIR